MISLIKMDQAYYNANYRQYCIAELAKQCIANGRWAIEEAFIKAQQEQDKCLSAGVETKENYLFKIKRTEDNKIIGEIWFGIIKTDGKKQGFLFDIHIVDEEQNKAYGKETLRMIETEIAKLGYSSIRLHVFRSNKIARSLYKKIGYKEFNSKGNSIWMEKEIKDSSQNSCI